MVGVALGVAVGVTVGVTLGVAVRVGVADGVGVSVGDGAAVRDGVAVRERGLIVGEGIRPCVPVLAPAASRSSGVSRAFLTGAQAPSANTTTKAVDMSRFFERTNALSPPHRRHTGPYREMLRKVQIQQG